MSCHAQINGALCFPLLKDLSAVAQAEGIKGIGVRLSMHSDPQLSNQFPLQVIRE